MSTKTNAKTGANKKRVIRRLKIIEGQVRGLQNMVSDGAYCIDIITQTSAVKRALSGVEDIIMEEHLITCAADQVRGGDAQRVAREILKVYKLKE